MKTLTDRQYNTLKFKAEELVVSPDKGNNIEGITILNVLSELHTSN